jgi:hypothetical protein
MNSPKTHRKTTRRHEAPPPENKPVEMQRLHPESMANRIAALDIGDSVSAVRRLDFDGTTKDEIETVKLNLKSTLSKAAVRAAGRSGNTYRTEAIETLTTSGDVLVVAVVTRTA